MSLKEGDLVHYIYESGNIHMREGKKAVGEIVAIVGDACYVRWSWDRYLASSRYSSRFLTLAENNSVINLQMGGL
jgi:hypothetical protein